MRQPSRRAHELVGQRFGRYVVLGVAARDSERRPRVRARCDCGAERPVLVYDLLDGKATQCLACRGYEGETIIAWGNTTHNIRTWAEILGIPRNTLSGRLTRGKDLRDAMTRGASPEALFLLPRDEDPYYVKTRGEGR